MWSLLTFFAVPIIVMEDERSIREILERSGHTFRETWGESLTVSFGIGILLLPVLFAGGAGIAWALLAPGNPIAVVAGATGFLVIVAAIVFTQVIHAIAKTALYQYATEQRRVGPFADLGPRAVFEEN